MDFRITATPTESEKDELFSGLFQYNSKNSEYVSPQDVGIYLENDSGEMLAGLIGYTQGNWLEIRYLWVSEAARESGIGSKLVHEAENIAKSRGCKYSFLNTYSSQTPEFYELLGYVENFH